MTISVSGLRAEVVALDRFFAPLPALQLFGGFAFLFLFALTFGESGRVFVFGDGETVGRE
jgi:hypothetical protein